MLLKMALKIKKCSSFCAKSSNVSLHFWKVLSCQRLNKVVSYIGTSGLHALKSPNSVSSFSTNQSLIKSIGLELKTFSFICIVCLLPSVPFHLPQKVVLVTASLEFLFLSYNLGFNFNFNNKPL